MKNNKFKIVKIIILSLGIILAILNVIFSFWWSKGFSYFRYFLAILGVTTIFLVATENIHYMLQKKRANKEQKKVSLSKAQLDLINHVQEFIDDSDEICQNKKLNLIANLNKYICTDADVNEEDIEEKIQFSETLSTLKLFETDNVSKETQRTFSGIETVSTKGTKKYQPMGYNRDFETVMSMICNLLPQDMKEALSEKLNYSSPELHFEKLSAFINNHVEKNSEIPASVRIYAILTNKSERKIKKAFQKMKK